MTTIVYEGRLGNNLIQFFASYLFAKKFNIFFKLLNISMYNLNNFFEYFTEKSENDCFKVFLLIIWSLICNSLF
jgi:hypothetical protein